VTAAHTHRFNPHHVGGTPLVGHATAVTADGIGDRIAGPVWRYFGALSEQTRLTRRPSQR